MIFAPNYPPPTTVFGGESMKNLLAYCTLIGLVVGMASCTKPTDEPTEGVVEVTEEGFVYTSSEAGSFQIWKKEGDVSTQLTDMADMECWWARISDDRSKILFYASSSGRDLNDYANASLWVMDGDGADQKPLIKSGVYGWEQQGLASWSHSGTQIVLAAIDSAIGRWQIYVTDENGLNPMRVTQRDNVDYLDPVFDVDDRSILCVTVPEGEAVIESNYEVVRVPLDGSEEERLTYNQRRDQHPEVSPDGNILVYESLIDEDYLSIGKWAIMKVDLGSGNESTLLEDEHINLFPRFSRNGENVLYTRLNVESFDMSIGQVEFTTKEASLIHNETGHALNADAF